MAMKRVGQPPKFYFLPPVGKTIYNTWYGQCGAVISHSLCGREGDLCPDCKSGGSAVIVDTGRGNSTHHTTQWCRSLWL